MFHRMHTDIVVYCMTARPSGVGSNDSDNMKRKAQTLFFTLLDKDEVLYASTKKQIQFSLTNFFSFSFPLRRKHLWLVSINIVFTLVDMKNPIR